MNKTKIKTEKTEEPCQRCENTECASNKVPQAECDCCVMTASQPLEKQLLAYGTTADGRMVLKINPVFLMIQTFMIISFQVIIALQLRGLSKATGTFFLFIFLLSLNACLMVLMANRR